MTPYIVHPSIGKITGKEAKGCTQFLGIKYAQLKDRFAPAEPCTYNASGIDATKYGLQVVGPPGAVDMEFQFIQCTLPKPDFPGISDVDGLTLNITVPEGATEGQELPVIVFLHGGGFFSGGNWWPQYDLARLVKLSADLGKPIIGVNISYRVGATGFVTSPELRTAGYKPNNGLRDQREALRWIKKHIAGFGGSTENVTVIGESAGGVSTGYLLLSKEPLAKRLICLGGCPPLLGQLPIPVADGMAKKVTDLLGLESVPSSEMVSHLLKLPMDDFWSKIPPSIPMAPIIEGDIIPDNITPESFSQGLHLMPGVEWIDNILMGDSKLDASIFAYSALLSRKSELSSAFQASANKLLGDYPDALASLLDHYSLPPSATKSLDGDEGFFQVLQFMNDIAFTLPSRGLAAQFPKDSFVLAFNEPNPWDGMFKGHASHILDVAFLFQNYNGKLDEVQRAGAVTFGSDVIKFVNGEAPWKPFNQGTYGVAVYADGKRRYKEPSDIGGTERSDFITQFIKDDDGTKFRCLMQIFTELMTR